MAPRGHGKAAGSGKSRRKSSQPEARLTSASPLGNLWSWILPRAFTKGNQSGWRWCTPVGTLTWEMHLARDDSRPKSPRHASLTPDWMQERKTEGTGKAFRPIWSRLTCGPVRQPAKPRLATETVLASG